ncbi:trypsin-2-like [Cylas formicarius]|uniref:trypsin-2-like n=1 Tax=Cylas formicarius TaxID=197179 RepID=UPI0029587D05|nr:trypsin-2-like [Cylas formicarius]
MTVSSVLVLLNLLGLTSCQDRIVGGREANIQDFPYQLALSFNGIPICGAVLISAEYALSAAHCISKQGQFAVRAGSDSPRKGGTVTFVSNALLHPNWAGQHDFDISILKLSPKLELSDKIRAIKLPEAGEAANPGTVAVVSGWGAQFSYVQGLTPQLRSVEVTILERRPCQFSYKWLAITPRMFCAGYMGGGKDSCQGDSGGPLVIDNKLYGLVSFGLSCAKPGYPGVYTNVPELREYIRINTGV